MPIGFRHEGTTGTDPEYDRLVLTRSRSKLTETLIHL